MHPAGISRRNRDFVERLHRQGTAFDVPRASETLGLDPDKTRRLLGYLARRGWLARVRRGLYVPVPLDARRSGEWREDSWVVAELLFSPCYIGGWSACEHWGLTEQVFRTVVAITAAGLHKRDVEIQGIRFHLTKRAESKLFGTVLVWRDQSKIHVSDATRTIIDVLDDPKLAGGIRSAADVLYEYMSSEHRNDDLLIEYGDRLGNRAVFKRLGYLLEHGAIHAPQLIAACLKRRSSGLSRLDPSIQTAGKIVRRWSLRINATVGPPGGEG